MPVTIRKVKGKNCYRVSTPGGVKARCTTRRKAEAQRRIINAADAAKGGVSRAGRKRDNI